MLQSRIGWYNPVRLAGRGDFEYHAQQRYRWFLKGLMSTTG
ncbi:hypothetical protein ABN211_02185 [Proteus terrae]